MNFKIPLCPLSRRKRGGKGDNCYNRGEWEGGVGSRSQGEEGKSTKKRLGEEGDGLGEGRGGKIMREWTFFTLT
jgi:hypothetical protein